MDHRIEHVLDTGGRSLSEADRQFVTLLFRELEQFQYQAPKDRALMFHPLRGYERYLIHKVTEVFPKLTSFSIGDEKNRRTVVCFKSKRKEQQMQLGQISPEKRPPSRGSMKEPKSTRVSGKSKTMESPAKARRRSSDPMSRNKPGRYNTWDGEAVKKRDRGLNVEGPVVNGDREHPKSDAEAIRREHRDPHNAKKKYRSRRSRSQPQLNDRHRPKQQSDYFDDSTDHQNSDIDAMVRKPRRLSSEAEKRTHGTKPVNVNGLVDETLRRGEDDMRTSSGTDYSGKDHSEHSDVENDEIPPSYEKMSDSKVKSKAKRNMRRIKRTNSTKSCPPTNNPKHDYVNSETILKTEAEEHHQDSPVFLRKGKSNLSDVDSRNGDPHARSTPNGKKGTSRRKNKKERKPSKDHDKSPNEENLRHDSYESSPFDSFSPEASEPIPNSDFKETVAIVESVPPETSFNSQSPRLVSSTQDINIVASNAENPAEKPKRLSDQIPLAAAEALIKSTTGKFDRESQTELQGSVVDAMMSTYNAHLDAFGQLAPQNLPVPQPGSTVPPSSLRTSGTSTPTLSSPASTYEKLGEYMYKAMLNFQNMLIGGHGLPPLHDFRPPQNGPTAFSPPAALFAPMTPSAPPLYMPWMGAYYPDPNVSRPPTVPFSTQSSAGGEPCCHMHHHMHQPHIPLNKMTSRSQGSLKGLRKDMYRPTPPQDDTGHWHGNRMPHRYRDNSDRTSEHSAHLSHSAKALDGFDSDVSSEITNPEVTVAEGGDGVMVYVRNTSNRSNSSAGASIGGSANSLHGPSSDHIPRISPIGHDNVFKKAPNSSTKKKREAKEKDSIPKSTIPKKSEKLARRKSDEIKPHHTEVDFANVPGITSEEAIFSLRHAPLATMDDDDIEGSGSASYTSSHSGHHDKMSDTPHADSARSLIGEDLAPLVCFDDNLEMACQDGSAEE